MEWLVNNMTTKRLRYSDQNEGDESDDLGGFTDSELDDATLIITTDDEKYKVDISS